MKSLCGGAGGAKRAGLRMLLHENAKLKVSGKENETSCGLVPAKVRFLPPAFIFDMLGAKKYNKALPIFLITFMIRYFL